MISCWSLIADLSLHYCSLFLVDEDDVACHNAAAARGMRLIECSVVSEQTTN